MMSVTLTLTLAESRVLKRLLRDSHPRTPAEATLVLSIHEKLMKEAAKKP